MSTVFKALSDPTRWRRVHRRRVFLLRWAAPEYLSVEMARRLTGVLLGFVVVVYANAIPKSLIASVGKAVRVGHASTFHRPSTRLCSSSV
ncbi:MAG: hypothetical protein JWP72_2092 [Massilia sp.]|nr:hypothetical protein [Massilia sp.]